MAARKAGIGGDRSPAAGDGPGSSAAGIGRLQRLQEIPFDSVRKRMTTFHPDPERDGGHLALVKGAPDLILDLCSRVRKDGRELPLDEPGREEILEANRGMAKQALRVLAFAYRPMDRLPGQPTAEEVERDLVFVGLAGMIDPPRREAIESIRICRGAGIRPVMITGDYKETAAAIARELGIISEESEARSGAELDGMDDARLQEEVRRVSVFARVSPEHKVRIVDALKANGHIVSMTGDGVNDAPALKRADVGVAMGITGTDVAKETASIILTDDNFASIVSAVEEGRNIYGNIRSFIFFLLSCNIAEILIIFVAMLVGWPIPLAPIQILWVNLVTDAFPALALGMERGERGVMKRPPRDPKEPVINRIMQIGIVLQSVAMTAAVLTAFRMALIATGSTETARVFAFATLIVSELLRSYTARSETISIFRLGPFSNPWIVGGTLVSFLLLLVVLYFPPLQTAFSTIPLTGRMWLLVLGLGVVPSLVAELAKPFLRRLEKRRIQALRNGIA